MRLLKVSFVSFLVLMATYSFSQCKLELFPQSSTIGINVTLDPPDPEFDCTATLSYVTIIGGQAITHQGFPLARVRNNYNRLSGAIFYLPFDNKAQDITITLSDPTTPLLNHTVLKGNASLKTEISNPQAKYVYYVSPVGSGNDFTANSPGRLTDVLKIITPNSEIRCFGGTYYVRNENLSGVDSLWITNEESGLGKKVIFSGLDTLPHNWQLVNGQTELYYTTSTVANPNLLFYDSIRLYPFRSLDELNRNKIGIGFNSLAQPVEFDANMDGFYRNPSTNVLCNSNWQYPKLLYVKLKDGSNPNNKKIQITVSNHAFYLNDCRSIRFSGIEFKGYGLSPGGNAVELKDCDDIAFLQCTFAMNDIGVLLSGSTSNTTIRACEFYDGNFSWSAWKMKATYDDYNPYSCVFPYYSRMLEKGGVMFQHGFSGRGVDISYSSFHDYSQAGHLSPPSVNENNPNSYEIDFHHNHVYRCFEDGFEIDGDARNVRIFENVFEQVNAPLSLAVAKVGPTYIYRNVFRDLKSDTFTTHPDLGLQITAGHPFKLQYGSADTAGEVNFMQNTIDAMGNNIALDFFSPGVWSNFRVWKNIFVADSGYLFIYRTPNFNPVDFKDNLFYSNTAKAVFYVDTNYKDQSQIRTNNFKDFYGIFNPNDVTFQGIKYADPVFTSNHNSPYYLDFISPVLDWPSKTPGITGSYFSQTHYGGAIPWELPEGIKSEKRPIFKVYPNPNRGFIHLESETEMGEMQIQLYNSNGTLVWQTAFESQNQTLAHTLPNGVYFLNIYNETQSFQSKLIVIH